MKMRSGFSWLRHFQFLRRVAVSLLTLAALAGTNGCVSSRSVSGETPTRTYGSKLNDAAAHGNSGAAKALLKTKPDLVFDRSTNGDTALHLAAFSGSRRIAKSLLASNAEVN